MVSVALDCTWLHIDFIGVSHGCALVALVRQTNGKSATMVMVALVKNPVNTMVARNHA
jgi:hypothetical protein